MERHPGECQADGMYRNPVRGPGLACQVCCAPIYPSEFLCSVCSLQRKVWGHYLANVVAPLSYAGPSTPKAVEDLWTYKDGTDPTGRFESSQRLSALVDSALAAHAQCFEAGFEPVEVVVTVPSGSVGARPQGHPIEDVIRWPGPHRRVELERLAEPPPRTIAPETLRIQGDVHGTHVLVMDDNWTSGASAQSVAVSVRNAGARRVSVLPLMRSLSSSWGPTAQFLRARPLDERFNSKICPVTSGLCPSPI